MQWSEPVPGFGLDVSPFGHQQRHHVDFPPLASHVQRCDVVFGRVVYVGTLVVQQGSDFVVSVVGGNVQGCESAFRRHVRVVLVLE